MDREFAPDLARCQTVQDLAAGLGVGSKLLELLAGDDRQQLYIEHKIPKKSKHRAFAFRVVFEPKTDELKYAHRTLARRLALYASKVDKTFPDECSNAYIRRRSIKRNASEHCGSALVLKADIKDFFPSISETRATNILLRLKIAPPLAALLARALCLDGTLSLGISASPLIANLACHDLDAALKVIAAKVGAKYTRYADDLTFSGDALPSKSQIATAVEAAGFKLSPTKFRITKRGQAQFVTGLSVTDPDGPHVPKRMKRQLHTELYFCRKRGVEAHFEYLEEPLQLGLARLEGTVRYVEFIEDAMAKALRAQWNAILEKEGLQVLAQPEHDRESGPLFAVIDEAIISVGARKFLFIGCALTRDRQPIEDLVANLLNNYVGDPFSSGDISAIRKEGLHSTSVHPELRNLFIQSLPTLPFRCFVVYFELPADDYYLGVYMLLMRWIAKQIIFIADRQRLTFIVENNPQIKERDIAEWITKAYKTAEHKNTKRPLTAPSVEIVKKPNALVSVPDFMLSIINKYVQPGQRSDSAANTQFERLRDRFALIFDVRNRKPYTRTKPFSPAALAPSDRPADIPPKGEGKP